MLKGYFTWLYMDLNCLELTQGDVHRHLVTCASHGLALHGSNFTRRGSPWEVSTGVHMSVVLSLCTAMLHCIGCTLSVTSLHGLHGLQMQLCIGFTCYMLLHALTHIVLGGRLLKTISGHLLGSRCRTRAPKKVVLPQEKGS